MLSRLRFFTSGESHGPGLTGILDGVPAGVPLTEADFTGADLTHADLSECELSRATLLGAVAQDSLWVRAVLRDADLTGVDLLRAVMQKADLRGACLERANLFAADLARVYSTDRTRYDGANLKKVRIHPVRRAT